MLWDQIQDLQVHRLLCSAFAALQPCMRPEGRTRQTPSAYHAFTQGSSRTGRSLGRVRRRSRIMQNLGPTQPSISIATCQNLGDVIARMSRSAVPFRRQLPLRQGALQWGAPSINHARRSLVYAAAAASAAGIESSMHQLSDGAQLEVLRTRLSASVRLPSKGCGCRQRMPGHGYHA